MTKEELWAIYVKRNPSFEGEGNVTLSKRGLRKLFDTTWDTAYFDGNEGVNTKIAVTPSPWSSSSPSSDSAKRKPR